MAPFQSEWIKHLQRRGVFYRELVMGGSEYRELVMGESSWVRVQGAGGVHGVRVQGAGDRTNLPT